MSLETQYYKATIRRRSCLDSRVVLNRMVCTTVNLWVIRTVSGNLVKSKFDNVRQVIPLESMDDLQ
jgi:hypothetical protein